MIWVWHLKVICTDGCEAGYLSLVMECGVASIKSCMFFCGKASKMRQHCLESALKDAWNTAQTSWRSWFWCVSSKYIMGLAEETSRKTATMVGAREGPKTPRAAAFFVLLPQQSQLDDYCKGLSLPKTFGDDLIITYYHHPWNIMKWECRNAVLNHQLGWANPLPLPGKLQATAATQHLLGQTLVEFHPMLGTAALWTHPLLMRYS